MSRLLALVGAIVMIAAALVVRGALDDESSGGGGRGGSGDGGRDVVVCVTELRDVCPPGGVVEDAGVTADRLADGEAIDAWLTFDPWPQMADDARTRAGLQPLFEETAPLASSRLAALVVDDLGECDWACVGGAEQIGTRSLDSGLGLLHLGAVATGYHGSPDFASNELPGAFTTFLDGFAEAATSIGAPVRRMLQTRGAEFDVALSYDAEAGPQFAAAAESNRAGMALTYPAPVINAVAVAAGDASLLDDVASALSSAGWQADAEPSGLPSAGVMTALRGLL